MKTIIYKHLTHVNTDELDYHILNQIFPNLDEDDEYEDHKEIYLDETNHLNTPVNITYLRGLLDNLEEEGANFVSIDYHPDHIKYDLDGLFVAEATQQEIDDYNQKDKEYQLKYAKSELERIVCLAHNVRPTEY
jgi:hypothetical protein